MTREEAINNLNMINIAFVEPVTKEQRKLIDDTFDIAIKALKESETVTEFADRCRECGAKYGKLLKQEPCEDLCKSCNTKGCIFQSGIKREKCDFYTSEKR